MHDNLIAHFDVTHARPDLGDDAGYVRPGDMRQDDFHSGEAAPRPDVVVVARRSLDLDQDIVVADRGLWSLLILEDLGAALGFEYHRLHFERSMKFSESSG